MAFSPTANRGGSYPITLAQPPRGFPKQQLHKPRPGIFWGLRMRFNITCLVLHVLHGRLTFPEAQLMAGSDEISTPVRSG
jgi:hypothetical protein